MKKIYLLMAASVLLLAGCNDDTKVDNPTTDAISLDANDKTFDAEGGTVDVVVTSSSNWTLTRDYEFDWVTPSTTTGSNGDTVTFTVEANTTEETLESVFTFTCGEARAEFTINVSAQTVVTPTLFELIDPVSGVANIPVKKQNDSDRLEVKIETDIPYTQTFVKEPEWGDEVPWINFTSKTQPETGVVVFSFDYTENTDVEEREATFTLASDNSDNPKKSITLKVIQDQTDGIRLNRTKFVVPLEGGSFDVEVKANVNYIVEIDDEAKSWLRQTASVDGKYTFTASATPGERLGKILFATPSGSLATQADISQKEESTINLAGNIAHNRAWPNWKDEPRLTGMTTITMEALVNGNFKKGDFQVGDDRYSTIMGIDGKFMFRIGGRNFYSNQLSLSWIENQPNTTDPNEQLYFDRLIESMDNHDDLTCTIPQHTWTHVAATFDIPNKMVRLYINGELVGEDDRADIKYGVPYDSNKCTIYPIDLCVPHNDELDDPVTRCFWVGYSYHEDRYLDGMISEVRIWDRVLAPAEFKEPGHFYSVDPNSNGLVAYWKFDDGGTGTGYGTIKDHSPLGNDLATEKPVDWQFVSIP